MYKMICIQCGKEYFSRTRNMKTCSDECRKARNTEFKQKYRAMKREKRTVECKTCGKLFHPNEYHKVYCSLECASKGYGKAKRTLGLTREYDRYDWSGEGVTDVPTTTQLQTRNVAYNKSVRKRREENMRLLAEDVAEADRLGMSYGMYMATRSTQ